MKKLQLIFDIILGIGLCVLYLLFFLSKTSDHSADIPITNRDIPDSLSLPIVYINTDSLLVHYKFAQEASDKLMTKQEDARLKLNSRAKTLQQEMNDFQRKLENNAFLSRERAESEQQRLLKKQQELEELENQLTQDIMAENQKLNMQLADTLINYLKIFNADGRFQFIFANNLRDNILLAAPQYDITPIIIQELNKRYTK